MINHPVRKADPFLLRQQPHQIALDFHRIVVGGQPQPAAQAAHMRINHHARRFLERQPQLTLRQVDPLIRELTQYRDLINLKTQEQNYERD